MYCSYNPNKSNISRHLDTLWKSLDLYSAHYENTILIGDFNVSFNDPHMESFCELYRFKSLIKDPTCFKSPENPSYIDLILTNSPHNFHQMIVSVMKTTFQRSKPRIFQYRDYGQFSNDNFSNLTKWHQEKENTYVAMVCHFLIKNYLAHTKKECN